jgi:hypothetical protein
MRIQGLESIAASSPFSPQAAFGKPATPADRLAGLSAHVTKFPCPTGRFAMPRLTLEQITRFGTLHAFFEKGPNGTGHVHEPDNNKLNVNGHAYSYAYQYVNNCGGRSVLCLNDPRIDISRGEVFSLMQNWYVGGSGSNLQTAEVGWQNIGEIPIQGVGDRAAGTTLADLLATPPMRNMPIGAWPAIRMVEMPTHSRIIEPNIPATATRD